MPRRSYVEAKGEDGRGKQKKKNPRASKPACTPTGFFTKVMVYGEIGGFTPAARYYHTNGKSGFDEMSGGCQPTDSSINSPTYPSLIHNHTLHQPNNQYDVPQLARYCTPYGLPTTGYGRPNKKSQISRDVIHAWGDVFYFLFLRRIGSFLVVALTPMSITSRQKSSWSNRSRQYRAPRKSVQCRMS